MPRVARRRKCKTPPAPGQVWRDRGRFFRILAVWPSMGLVVAAVRHGTTGRFPATGDAFKLASFARGRRLVA